MPTLNFTIPLWDRRWSREALLAEKEMSPRAYGRAREMRVYQDGERTFPSVAKCVLPCSPADLRPRALRIFAGFDPASATRSGSAFAVVGLDKDGRRLLLDVSVGRWTWPQAAAEQARLDALYRPDVWLVETNAVQDQYVETLRARVEDYPFVTRIRAHMTGGNKWDAQIGLPSLEDEFSRGEWVIPAFASRGHSDTCECGWCRWRTEFEEHPGGNTSDLVMATWFPASRMRAVAAARSNRKAPSAEPERRRLRPGLDDEGGGYRPTEPDVGIPGGYGKRY